MKKIIVAISGASGPILGFRLLGALKACPDVETHLVMSRGAAAILLEESGVSYEQVCALADRVYAEGELTAPIASGSYRTDGMIVLPCSMKSLSGIANAYDENLLIRAADVCLKEGRKLVLCPRETPLNRIHLKNMLSCAEAGAVILPPVFSFYARPLDLDDCIDQFLGKVLMQFGVDYPGFRPWEGVK